MTRVQTAALGVLAGVLTIVGSIGAWATFQGQSFAGTDANRGKTVAIAAGIGALLLLLGALLGWRWLTALAVVAGLISAGLTIWSLASINDFADAPSGLDIGRGWGIWLATIGSIVLVLAALVATFAPGPGKPAAAQPAPPPAS